MSTNTHIGISAVVGKGVSSAIGIEFSNVSGTRTELVVSDWTTVDENAPLEGERISLVTPRPTDTALFRWRAVILSDLDAGAGTLVDKVIAFQGNSESEVSSGISRYADGDSPFEGPKWLPGSGHSGCKFVGNPTWIANSGVNGGQIGYAATLKEVGDWQQ